MSTVAIGHALWFYLSTVEQACLFLCPTCVPKDAETDTLIDLNGDVVQCDTCGTEIR